MCHSWKQSQSANLSSCNNAFFKRSLDIDGSRHGAHFVILWYSCSNIIRPERIQGMLKKLAIWEGASWVPLAANRQTVNKRSKNHGLQTFADWPPWAILKSQASNFQRLQIYRSEMMRPGSTSFFIATWLCGSLASPSEYWALTSEAVRQARISRGQSQFGRTLRTGKADPVSCGRERYNGAAGPMWFANPYAAGCSKASMDLTYAYDGKVHVAKKGDLIKMQCDNWECPIPAVTDCYSDRNACASDEWCMVITHEKWGAWAVGKDGKTPNFEICDKSYTQSFEALAEELRDNKTLAALKMTRDVICGGSVEGVANGIKLEGYTEDRLWRPSHGRCVKYRQKGQSCIPTLPTSGRFANAFVRRVQTGPAYPNGGTMERPLACAPGLICTGPGFDILPSTCVEERPADVCFSGPWWDSSRCPRTAGDSRSGMNRDWAIESLQTALLLFPGEVASAMNCNYWTGELAPFTASVRKVTYEIFGALWPVHLVGEYPSLAELEEHMWEQTGVNLTELTPDECAAAAERYSSQISTALALAGTWSHRPNLLWSLIHFVVHNQPSPMSRDAVAASRALASHLSENFWCNDCRGFFTIGVLAVVGLPPESIDGEAHAKYWNLGHNIASEHVATTRGGHPWINTLEEAEAAGVSNPFYVPFETSVKMWHVDQWRTRVVQPLAQRDLRAFLWKL